MGLITPLPRLRPRFRGAALVSARINTFDVDAVRGSEAWRRIRLESVHRRPASLIDLSSSRQADPPRTAHHRADQHHRLHRRSRRPRLFGASIIAAPNGNRGAHAATWDHLGSRHPRHSPPSAVALKTPLSRSELLPSPRLVLFCPPLTFGRYCSVLALICR